MASKHNFRAKTINDAMLGELVNLANRVGEFYSIKLKDTINQGKSPPSSPPGGPPYVRTGTLLRSFRTRPAKRIGKRVVLTLGTNVLYARPLEYGTTRMAARPYFGPTVRDSANRARVDREVAKVGARVRAAIRRSARRPQ